MNLLTDRNSPGKLKTYLSESGGKRKTLGIMQVASDELISDEESVRLGARKIVSDYYAALDALEKANPGADWNMSEALSEAIKNYNRDDQYLEGVLELHL